MKKTALSLLALAGLVVPASAFAQPAPDAHMVAPVLALPRIPTQVIPIRCDVTLSNLVQKLAQSDYRDHVAADATLMVGSTGYAWDNRPVPNAEGFYDDAAGQGSLSGVELAGSVKVTDFYSDDSLTLGFRIQTVDGATKMRWRFKGKSYSAAVDSCANNIWTATTATSAIVVKLAAAEQIPPPPQ